MKFVHIDGTNHDGYAALDIVEGRAKTMTVKELIEALSTLDPDAKTIFRSGYGDYVIESVSQT